MSKKIYILRKIGPVRKASRIFQSSKRVNQELGKQKEKLEGKLQSISNYLEPMKNKNRKRKKEAHNSEHREMYEFQDRYF